MKNKLLFAIFTIPFTLLLGCNGSGGNSGATNQSTISHNNDKSPNSSKLETLEKAALHKKLLGGSSQTSGISPGTGYSSDTDSIALANCYQPLSTTKDGQTSKFSWDSGVSTSQLSSEIGMSADLSAGFGKFSANDTFKYLNSIKEDSLSYTVNYYNMISSDVITTYLYAPSKILNADGQIMYDDGNNPMFRLYCGDKLITSYNEGALLVLSLKINFADKTQKEQFSNTLGAKIGGILSASTSISKLMSQYNMHGTISIHGFQLGGHPEQLSSALSQSIASCDINNVSACQKTIEGLIAYANNNFPSQFVKDGSIWVSPLVPLGKVELGRSVSSVGVKLANSYVTPEVEQARQHLIDQENKYEYYLTHLNHVIDNYPLNKLNSEFKDKLIALRNITKANLDILEYGQGAKIPPAINCWEFPEECVSDAAKTEAALSNITPETITTQTALIKYNLQMDMYNGGYYWPTGASGTNNTYFTAASDSGDNITGISSSFYDGTSVRLTGTVRFSSDGSHWSFTYSSAGYDGKDTYTGGQICVTYMGGGGHWYTSCNYAKVTRSINPYYFAPYSF